MKQSSMSWKKTLALVAGLFLLFTVSCQGGQEANVELLTNTSFETVTEAQPQDWKLTCYSSALSTEGSGVISDSTAPDGEKVLVLNSPEENDVRFVQTVKVQKDAYYRFSAMVKTENVTGEKEGGACLGVIGSFFRSDYCTGTTDWTELVVYGQASEAGSIDIALRLGYYGSVQSGTVYYDKVSFMRVEREDIPAGVTVQSMEPYSTTSSSDEAEETTDVVTPVVLRGLVYLAVMILLLIKGKDWMSRLPSWGLPALLAVALILRLILSVTYVGFTVDVKDFALWGKRMADVGLGGFYEADYFCDYPPLYMLVLGLLYRVADLFGLTLHEGGGLLILKLPAMVCDLATALLIYRIAQKHLDKTWAYTLSLLYAFNPAAILNSAVWGQVDSVLVLLLMLTFYLLDKDRYGLSLGVYIVALLTKPQAVLFGPVMLVATVLEFLRIAADFRENRKTEGKRRLVYGFGAFFGGVALFLLLSLLMANGQPFTWLLNKYMTTLGSYQYAAVNVFNFMALLGGQWTDATASTVFGLSYATLGTVLVVLVMAYAALLMVLEFRRTKGKIPSSSLWLYAALTVMGVVIFSTRSHERYLFPVIAFLLVSYIHLKDKRLLWSSVGASFLSFLNAAVVLYLYESTKTYMEKRSAILMIGSLLTVVLFAVVALAAWDHATGRVTAGDSPTSQTKKGKTVNSDKTKSGTREKTVSMTGTGSKLDRLLSQRSYTLPKISWKDGILCLLITAGYGVVALSNLGDTKAPQTYWDTQETSMYTVADFGETVTADRLLYRTVEEEAGFLRVEVSGDGETYELMSSVKWEDTAGDNWYEAEVEEAHAFRYLRLTALSEETQLHELAVLEDGQTLIPVSFTDVVSPVDTKLGQGAHLFDEPDSLPADLAAALPEEGSTPKETDAEASRWRIREIGDYALIDFGTVTTVQRGSFYPGLIPKGIDFTVYFSSDGQTWEKDGTVSQAQGKLYYWRGIPKDNGSYTDREARYVLIQMETVGARVLEMGFFASAEATSVIPVASVTGPHLDNADSVSKAFDEQDMVPTAPSYMNSMYFDEIYHARTGYESANGLKIYEVSHPPLGKDFIAMSIETFGMTPFAWRLPGAVAGILMLPVMYFLGLFLFRKRIWATGLSLLMTLDGMHFAQTRIATIDSFAVLFILLMFLFMFWYQSISFYDKPLWKTFIPLGLCGLSFGLGVASKWIGVYAGAGLAVLFFITVYRRYKEYELARKRLSSEKGENKAYLQHVTRSFKRNVWWTILFCVVFFVVIPCIIYALSYMPYYRAEGETRPWLEVLLENQTYMFNYHSKLQSTHTYQSDWYTWPFIYMPMWFYKGYQLPEGMSACISSFGNPAVWYAGFVCTVIGIGLFVRRLMKNGMDVRFQFVPEHKKSRFERFFDPGDEAVADCGSRDMWTLLFFVVGIACNLLPWTGIDRCVFIYHYFATTPFIMMFTIWCLRELCRKKPKLGGILFIGLMVVTLALFVFFKPVWTGTTVPTWYIRDYLKWFDSWEFGVGG